ncbi:AAA family ATPase, partial [bacterium]|nr:AAA family ATPase [bacterium]
MIKLFVSSTGHKSGKTLITAGISATMHGLGYTTGVYKPFQTNAP